MVDLSYSGKFQFSRMVHLYHFVGLNFAYAHTHTHYVLYNRAYFVLKMRERGWDKYNEHSTHSTTLNTAVKFVGLIFMVRQSFAKTMKTGPLENFPLYGKAIHDILSQHLSYRASYPISAARYNRTQ